ncbi:hypothetical protein, partial [Microcystis sp.]|uniref:hypothetical protein n=1 Tax=Microcystis sp. TaxID=1127 RepID=UPI00391AADE8
SVLPNKTARTKVSESKNILTKTAGWVTVTPNPPHPRSKTEPTKSRSFRQGKDEKTLPNNNRN